jgi:hypothetical protein
MVLLAIIPVSGKCPKLFAGRTQGAFALEYRPKYFSLSENVHHIF